MLRRYSVEVELLSRKGGGRRYTYRYNLHYAPPDVGDIVVVPFAKWILPAVVLSAKRIDDTLFALYESTFATHDLDTDKGISSAYLSNYRPILGIERQSKFILQCASVGNKIIERSLRSAHQAYSFFTPASFENEYSVCFQVTNEHKFVEYLETAVISNRIERASVNQLTKVITKTGNKSKRIGARETRYFLGDFNRRDKPRSLSRDALLQAMINLNLIRFSIVAKHLEFEEWIDNNSCLKTAHPNLFTHPQFTFLHNREGVTSNFANEVPLFTAWSSLVDILDAIVGDIYESKRLNLQHRLRVVITPSVDLCNSLYELFCEKKLSVENSLKYFSTHARTRELIRVLRKGNTDVLVGTSNTSNLVGLLGAADIYVINSDSSEFADEPTRPSIFSILAAVTSSGSKVTFHHFTGAGARESATKPTKPLSVSENDWQVLNIEKWVTCGDEETPEISLISDLLRRGKPLLVVLNKLGHGSGFYCAECYSYIGCPVCDSPLNSSAGVYHCRKCGNRLQDIACSSCNSPLVARISDGVLSIAEKLRKTIGNESIEVITAESFSEKELVPFPYSSMNLTSVVLTTDVCLSRLLSIKPQTILVLDVSERLQRYQYTGAEAVSAYLRKSLAIMLQAIRTCLFLRVYPKIHLLTG